MLHHASLPARHPRRVAEVLAELMEGHALPFLGPLEDAWFALAGDGHGTLVEVYPDTVSLVPGPDHAPATYGLMGTSLGALPFHLLLSCPKEAWYLERAGELQGWHTGVRPRGGRAGLPEFQVVEMWVENRVLLEWLTPAQRQEYESIFQLATLEPLARAFLKAQPSRP